MENENIKISNELLQKLSAEELVDLKIQVEELLEKMESTLEICDEGLKS